MAKTGFTVLLGRNGYIFQDGQHSSSVSYGPNQECELFFDKEELIKRILDFLKQPENRR